VRDFKLANTKYKVLHIAPFDGLNKNIRQLKNIEYCAASKKERAYSYQENLLNVDLTNLLFEDSVFDIVISVHILEHIEEDALALKEIVRVLNVNGTALLMVPQSGRMETYEGLHSTSPRKRKNAYGQWDHVRLYGKDFKSRLMRIGFKVEEKIIAKDFSAQERLKYGLTDESIFICKKT